MAMRVALLAAAFVASLFIYGAIAEDAPMPPAVPGEDAPLTALEGAVRYALPLANRPYAEVQVNGGSAEVLYCGPESPLRRFTPCELQPHEVCAPDAEMICLIGEWVRFAIHREKILDRPYGFEGTLFEVTGEVPVDRNGVEKLFLVVDSYDIVAERDEEDRVVSSTPPLQRFLYNREEGLIAVSQGHDAPITDDLVDDLRSRGNILISDGPGFGAPAPETDAPETN